ncbi:retrovirus-related Pol polyprotein from transposon TNT 1-94 [Trifolium medium]|uniref:Retrovirus-related Pol polyprotein from transposon TNT 1-94 n=1 Tax=Trifolium medium TaxID=97028 RepID=A0A392M4E0_9FABA|nr:retrovirus-related Pol polyprotein from transposon TNT 1-94 [Trifolium medium]
MCLSLAMEIPMATNATLQQGQVGSDGLYEFPTIRLHTAKPPLNSQYLWHLRLGHPHSNILKLVLQHKLHSLPSRTQYTHPLELVFSDLWGPSPQPSTLGYNYYTITFVDAYSRIYLLKFKSDAFIIFKQFKAMVENP